MNVPKLRFKEFTDEWIEYVLQSESDVRDGTHDSPKYVEKGYPLITSKNLTDMGTLDFSNVSYLKQDDFDKINQRSKVDIGDILFGMIGTIGKPVRIDRDDFAIKNVALIKEKGLIKNDYLIHYLHTPTINKQFANNQDGGTQKFIALDKIRKLKIKMPSRKEQEKIVSLFNLLDKKIELQSKKIEDLKLFKKGLINKLFENTSLKEVHINDLGTIVTGTTPSKSNNKYWDNGNIVWVTPSDINENRDINNSLFKITEKGLKHGRFIPKDSILVTCIASIGKNAILKVDGTCNQQINAIIPNKNYNSNYIYYLMNSISNYMKSIAGTSATSIINKEEFSKITIKVHRKDQQDYIDKILSKFETKLLLENDNLVKLQELKKCLKVE